MAAQPIALNASVQSNDALLSYEASILAVDLQQRLLVRELL